MATASAEDKAPASPAPAPATSPASAPAKDDDPHLPAAVIKRLVKAKLEGATNISSDALLAFGESARVFINYISCTANDICKDSKRQTISAEDVFKALEEVDFEEFVAPLRDQLSAFKKSSKDKAEKRKEAAAAKKRKGDDLAEDKDGKDGDKDAADKQ